jgi:hypothetical protein
LHWSWDDTEAANAVATARLLGRHLTQGRTRDSGYVRNMFHHNGRVYITIDRAVPSLSGHMINRYPTTYTYPLHRRKYYGRCPRYFSSCTPDMLLAQFRKGTEPADGTRRLVGRLVGLRKDTGWFVSGAYRWKFESHGDPGHCGC